MNDLYGRLMPSSKKQLNDKAEYLKRQTDALEKKLGAVQKQPIGQKKTGVADGRPGKGCFGT